MTHTPEEQVLPPSLRFLRVLVIVLMITMIGGVIAMVSLLVTRLPNARDVPALPANLAMPAGATAQAVTFGAGWIAVVSQDNRILIFGVDGKLRQQVQIVAP